MNFLSQMTLLRWLTFLLGSLTVTLTVLHFWISIFWRWYLFCNGFPSLGKFWSCCYLSFHWISVKPKTKCPILSYSLWLLVLIKMFFVINWEMFYGKISLNSVLLVLLVKFRIKIRLEMMCILLLLIIRSILTHLHGFQLPACDNSYKYFFSFVSTEWIFYM